MIESAIETKVRNWCKSEGHLFIKLAHGPKGMPDRLLVTRGQVFFLEFKTKSGVVSPHQKVWITVLKSLQMPVAVVRSLDDVKNIVGTRCIVNV